MRITITISDPKETTTGPSHDILQPPIFREAQVADRYPKHSEWKFELCPENKKAGKPTKNGSFWAPKQKFNWFFRGPTLVDSCCFLKCPIGLGTLRCQFGFLETLWCPFVPCCYRLQRCLPFLAEERFLRFFISSRVHRWQWSQASPFVEACVLIIGDMNPSGFVQF